MKREATPDMRRIVLKGYRPSEDGGEGKTVIEDIIDVPMLLTPAGNLTAAVQRRIINAEKLQIMNQNKTYKTVHYD